MSPQTQNTQPTLGVRKTVFQADNGSGLDVFSLSLGGESIPLLPLRNWGQLDIHKWVSRGKLPTNPPGLEITQDHVKIAGETVLIADPDGSSKLQKAFSEWLDLEKETLELARKKLQARPVVVEETALAPAPLHFRVEVDKGGQVHIRCVQGKEVLATIGLNTAGFKSLVNQGLLRKPHDVKVGALHDWLELDGVLYSFEKGNNASLALEKALNEQYLPHVSGGEGKDVVIYDNPASSTGFDIQFPTSAGGIRENRRRPLNEETLDLLQDPGRCGLLHKGLVIKLTRPTIIFKLRTPDGGERYLESSPDNVVTVADEDGNEKSIDLSRPVNYMHLSPADLTAVFNHPAIHKHSKIAPRQAGGPAGEAQKKPAVAAAPSMVAPAQVVVQASAPLPMVATPALTSAPSAPVPATPPKPPPAPEVPVVEQVVPPEPTPPKKRPNEWLRPMLEQPPIRHDWLSFLLYGEMAATFGNSTPGNLGLSSCWASAQDQEQTQDISNPEFRGIFLTQKGGFGFLNQGHIARFNKGVAFIGTQDDALEGIDVNLIAAGVDAEQRLVFVVSESYRSKFGVQEQSLTQELKKLQSFGAVVQSVKETLESPEPLLVLWTVPAVQQNPDDPKAVESWRQEEASVGELAGAGTT
jgi:hypothetical protein